MSINGDKSSTKIKSLNNLITRIIPEGLSFSADSFSNLIFTRFLRNKINQNVFCAGSFVDEEHTKVQLDSRDLFFLLCGIHNTAWGQCWWCGYHPRTSYSHYITITATMIPSKTHTKIFHLINFPLFFSSFECVEYLFLEEDHRSVISPLYKLNI